MINLSNIQRNHKANGQKNFYHDRACFLGATRSNADDTQGKVMLCNCDNAGCTAWAYARITWRNRGMRKQGVAYRCITHTTAWQKERRGAGDRIDVLKTGM